MLSSIYPITKSKLDQFIYHCRLFLEDKPKSPLFSVKIGKPNPKGKPQTHPSFCLLVFPLKPKLVKTQNPDPRRRFSLGSLEFPFAASASPIFLFSSSLLCMRYCSRATTMLLLLPLCFSLLPRVIATGVVPPYSAVMRVVLAMLLLELLLSPPQLFPSPCLHPSISPLTICCFASMMVVLLLRCYHAAALSLLPSLCCHSLWWCSMVLNSELFSIFI